MFILVNHSTDFGLDEVGRFATPKEAFDAIAYSVKESYGYEIDIDKYPFDNDLDMCEYAEGDKYIAWGYSWCNAYDNAGGCDYEDHWMIIQA